MALNLKYSVFTDADTEKIDKTFDTNVKGLLLCAQEAIKYMIQNSVEGHVININRYLSI